VKIDDDLAFRIQEFCMYAASKGHFVAGCLIKRVDSERGSLLTFSTSYDKKDADKISARLLRAAADMLEGEAEAQNEIILPLQVQ
jgi:hypothetical protein